MNIIPGIILFQKKKQEDDGKRVKTNEEFIY